MSWQTQAGPHGQSAVPQEEPRRVVREISTSPAPDQPEPANNKREVINMFITSTMDYTGAS
jgi:hypothetical protein